jgi:holo-[acyl-carrier protein] synthase
MPAQWPTTCAASSRRGGARLERIGAFRYTPVLGCPPRDVQRFRCGVPVIYGIGTDICDVRRIRASLEKHGERFAVKILSDGELAMWRARSTRWPERGVRYLATRFSAKEAFSKAIGLGMRMPMTWRLCEVGKLPSGKPAILLHGELKVWFEAKGLSAHVSVTDETDYAASFCVVERV